MGLLMLLASSKTYETSDFQLSTGAHLPTLTVAYETWGELAADGNNAILLCHGYTNHSPRQRPFCLRSARLWLGLFHLKSIDPYRIYYQTDVLSLHR